jgi:hypothetical protein
VVSAAGVLQTWQVALTPSPHWVAESTTSTIPQSEQDPGFFTVVSSNERTAGSMIIWAVGRPSSTTTGLTLYAFSATPSAGTLALLYSAPAGQWPNLGGNADTVPLVANGRVYVAAYKTLMIFGPNGAAPAAVPPPAAATANKLPAGMRRVTGQLLQVEDSVLTLRTRSGQTVRVDAAAARASERVPSFVVGQAYTVIAPSRNSSKLMAATSITRAKPGQGAWPTDE